ncbi:MAG: hypothetical protein HC805_02180 [Alkalinema sp. RL_2_19]|nr:hypothetical protein [Alkalinema sp. RL_2_19]
MKKSSFTWFVIQFEVLFGFFTLMFFLLFSSSMSQDGYPVWYSLGTTILELFAFFLATVLCLRNAFSEMIVSSRKVWLGIGLGMLFYFVGNIFFAYWELVLQREPDVSPGDLFYIVSYLFLMVSMGLAVFERRLNLEGWQYGVISGVGLIGVVIAVLLALGDQSAAPAAAQLNPFQAKSAITAPPLFALAPSESLQSPLLTVPALIAPPLEAIPLIIYWCKRRPLGQPSHPNGYWRSKDFSSPSKVY